MDVEIEKLEISAGVEDEKEQRRGVNQEFDEAQLELLIERIVERFLRQIVRK